MPRDQVRWHPQRVLGTFRRRGMEGVDGRITLGGYEHVSSMILVEKRCMNTFSFPHWSVIELEVTNHANPTLSADRMGCR